MPDDTVAATRRVRTTMPLEIGGVTQPPGFEMDLPEADAEVMVERRRAERVGEPLLLTDAERPDDAHPGEQVEAHGAEPVEPAPTPHEET